jgi:hypothetical protein
VVRIMNLLITIVGTPIAGMVGAVLGAVQAVRA